MTLSVCDANRQVTAIGGEHAEPGVGMEAIARVLGIGENELRAGALDAVIGEMRSTGIGKEPPSRDLLLAFAVIVWEQGFFAGVIHERAR